MRDRILPHDGTSATLELDLKPYVQAHHQFKANKITKQQYSTKHTELTHEIKNINSQLLWTNLFEQASNQFTPETKNELMTSPAYMFIEQQFSELLKNAVDSVLAAHVNHQKKQPLVSNKLHLKLTINDDPRYNLATFKLSDNGSGFKPSFLETIQTKTTRENTHYYQQRGSEKHGQKNSLVIGGAGKGLQQLVALADHGEKVIGPMKREACFEVPRVSALNFSNKTAPEHGAIISLTTSKTALVLITQNTNHTLIAPQETHAQNLRNRRGLKPLSIYIPEINDDPEGDTDKESNDGTPSI